MGGDSVRVAVRVRPFNGREKDRGAKLIIAMNGGQTIITNPHNNEDKKFTFDFSYWSHDNYTEAGDGLLVPDSDKYADQKHVFDTLGMDVLNNAYQGYNCSLFAYGQTGSGKSFSMVGYGVNKGIVPITCDTIFKGISDNSDPKKSFEVTLSMLEIYNEAVRDLLSKEPPTKGGLKVRQHPKLGVQVVGLKEVPVGSYDEINKRIENGTSNRTVAATNMNATSSRAHTVVAIMYTQIEKDGKGPGKDKKMTSKINLVDLAGSERAESTGATGDRLKEGAAINLSLSMLGNVIKALADKSNNPKSKVLVPYRDSKLTQILQDALGGNSKTIMIAALSPADINYEETLSTLRYADRAKQIKNKAVINIDPQEQMIKKLKEDNERLLAQLKAATGGGDFDPSLFGGGDGDGGKPMTEEEKEAMKKQLQEEMAAELAENQRIMEEQAKSWEEKLKAAKTEFGAGDQRKKEEEEKMKTVPHMVNVNEDPSLSGMVVKFFEDGESTIGRKDADEAHTIVLGGLSIQKNHAAVRNDGGKVRIVAHKGAKLLVNGKQIDEDTEHELHHNDRVMIGANHLNIFRNPGEREAEGVADESMSWDDAQDEIARGQGFAAETRDLSKLTQAEREHVLLQDEIVRLVPLVAEANDISAELAKDVTFEVKLVNKPLASGKFRTEVAVIMRNPITEQSWMWSKAKFINRHALFRELYERFAVDGEASVEQEKDPFWEPAEPVLIGNAYAYLNPLSYGIELESQATVRDYKGKEEGVLNITVHPMAIDGNDPTAEEAELLIEEPAELVGKEIWVRVAIESGRGFNSKFSQGLHVEWTWGPGEEPEKFVTPVMTGTANPDWKYVHKVHIPSVSKDMIEYFNDGAITFGVYGLQDNKPKSDKPVRRPGASSEETAALRMKLQELEVEFEKKVGDLSAQLRAAQGETRVTRGRLDRILKRNGQASKLVQDYRAAGTLPPDNAAAIQKLIKPGGISKFKAAAKLVGATQVAKKQSEGGGDDKSKSCIVQ